VIAATVGLLTSDPPPHTHPMLPVGVHCDSHQPEVPEQGGAGLQPPGALLTKLKWGGD
jgi:hypothetical protein